MTFRQCREVLMRVAAHRLAFWLRALVAVLALSQCFAGRGGQRLFIFAALALPLLLLLIDPSFRLRCLVSAARLWRDLSRPSAEWKYWFGGFVFVGAPAALLYVLHPTYQIDSGDGWAVIPTAISIVREGNPEIGEMIAHAPHYLFLSPQADPTNHFQGLPYGARRLPSGVYSRYPAGMTALAVPVMVISRLSGANFDSEATVTNLDRWTSVCVAVLLLLCFFRVALRFAPPSTALVTAWFLAAGSAVYTTVSQSLWQHGGVTIGMLLLINVELDERNRKRWWGFAFQAIAVGLMYGCRLSSGLLVASFGVWLLARSPTRAVLFLLASIVGILPWAMYYQNIYGTPFGPSSEQLTLNGWNADIWEPMLGVLFSPGRGLFVYQPWVVLSIVGVVASARYGITWMCTLAIMLQVVLISSWDCWWGGCCWGSRLLTEAIPLMALLALRPVTWLLQSRGGRLTLALLFLVSFFTQMTGIWHHMVAEKWFCADRFNLWYPPNWQIFFN